MSEKPKTAVWFPVIREPEPIVHACERLRAWCKVDGIDTVIIQINPTRGLEVLVDDFIPICDEYGVRLLPCFSVHPGFPTIRGDDEKNHCDLDDYAGWPALSRYILDASALTGSPTIMLSTEHAIDGVRFGHIDCDYAALADAMQHLPSAVELVWYPAMAGLEDSLEQRRMRQIANCLLAAHPNVYWLDVSRAGRGAVKSFGHHEAELRDLNRRWYGDRNRTLYQQIFTGRSSHRWKPGNLGIVGESDVGAWLAWQSIKPPDVAVLYPGVSPWVDGLPDPTIESAGQWAHWIGIGKKLAERGE